ncbi:hypothetical protein DFQ28_000339 [Apophysomyces sp. BC1034]|nr:hypothetical protein DFQ28_000339 [Apophysomyces sp. BC1034]
MPPLAQRQKRVRQQKRPPSGNSFVSMKVKEDIVEEPLQQGTEYDQERIDLEDNTSSSRGQYWGLVEQQESIRKDEKRRKRDLAKR